MFLSWNEKCYLVSAGLIFLAGVYLYLWATIDSYKHKPKRRGTYQYWLRRPGRWPHGYNVSTVDNLPIIHDRISGRHRPEYIRHHRRTV